MEGIFAPSTFFMQSGIAFGSDLVAFSAPKANENRNKTLSHLINLGKPPSEVLRDLEADLRREGLPTREIEDLRLAVEELEGSCEAQEEALREREDKAVEDSAADDLKLAKTLEEIFGEDFDAWDRADMIEKLVDVTKAAIALAKTVGAALATFEGMES